MIKKETKTMKELLAKEKEVSSLPQPGDIVEGKIIKKSNNELILELEPFGTGIVYGAELRENRDMIRDLEIGKKISALVLDSENDDNYIELSLKEANIEKGWSAIRQEEESNKTVSVKIIEANKGGLVIRLSGIIGFLPVSQLSADNYPKVEDGDKNKILQELNKFIGTEMEVKIIGLDKNTDKLVVSEKVCQEKKLHENLSNYKKGDTIEGTVTALTNFGAFVKFDENIEGLIHISELGWQIIDHPNQVIKEKDKVKAQIIDIRNGQVSLSIKALKKDPWEKIKKDFKNEQTVKGKVIKFNPSGAFVEIKKEIYGMIHLSEFSKQNKEMENVLKIGESYNFEIISFIPEAHKMILGIKNI
ncbi:MAG: S1 RNA-binding domain-containing protein [Patescibacteria group bacterium]|nr:S1 RNA-binding domain-containing protein [Patescibacteria group bacterium]